MLYSEDFESYETGTKPKMDVYESTGSIKVETVGAAKALHIQNINGNANAMAEKSIDKIEKKPVEASVRFMQTQTGSSQNKVLELSGDGTSVTVFANAGALYIDETKICDYVANKWYTVSLDINLFNSKIDVSVNGEEKLTDTVTAVKAIEKIAIGASQSPGFWVDDIKLLSEQNMTQMSIDGNSTAVIPRNGENEYKFFAYCKDENGEKITVSDIDWSISPVDYQGITTDKTADGFIIRVTSGAIEGEITLTASIENGAYSQTKTVKLEKVSADEIRIDGDPRISGENGETYRYGYEVVMNDQNGDTIENYGDFIWTMTGVNGYVIPSSIKLNETTGIITVAAETPYREFIELKATSVDDPDIWQKKKILITDHDSHVLDSRRYDAVKAHIDNVIEYAKDPYDDTPLIADLVNVKAKAPGALIMGDGTTAYLHNLGAQSNLMRSMVNLSNFENDDKYKNQVNDIYRYNIDVAESPTYLFEGGHMELDLRTKTANAYTRAYCSVINEMKSGFIYRVPMFEVDYEAGETLTKSAFVGHTGFNSEHRWKNVLVGRHWYCATDALTPETADYYWNDTSKYDWERKGAITYAEDCNFLIAYSEMFWLLAEYYECARTQEEKDKILEWGDIIYSSLDQTGYNPLTGEYTGMFNETNGSKHYEDWSKIYATWEKNGRHWYDKTNYTSYVPGDRWLTNVILGDRDIRAVSDGGEGFGPSSDGKSWVNDHYDPDPMKGVNEQNWMLFLEPYMFTRENSCIVQIVPGLFTFLEILEDDSPLKTKIIEKYTNAIYNYLNLRYDWEDSHFDAKMSWGLDVTGWEYPHNGYYGTEGSTITGKVPETELVEGLAMLCHKAVQLAEQTGENESASNTYPEKKRKEQLLEQAEYIWSVLRNLCKINYDMGDIGNPFKGEPAKLNLATTSTNTALLQGATRMYQLYADEQFLKLASNIGNNIVASQFNDGNGVFANSNAILTTSSNLVLPALLQLEATLLDDYDKLIEAQTIGRVRQYYDPGVLGEHGGVDEPYPYTSLLSLAEAGVTQQMLIIEKPFTMKAGEQRKIKYTVLPYDAGTGVLWDVSDPSIADISDSGVITAHKRGTVDVRCVSSSVQGLKSETITVTVE